MINEFSDFQWLLYIYVNTKIFLYNITFLRINLSFRYDPNNFEHFKYFRKGFFEQKKSSKLKSNILMLSIWLMTSKMFAPEISVFFFFFFF